MKVASKTRYVKVESVGPDETGEELEWYAVGTSRRNAKELADEMGMPMDNRKYKDLYLTDEQYGAIPEI